ncbi:MAG: outer membrane lipoprotein-sorting protein [Gemmatimonadota bacterium]|nr:outer membrane lipoprotein-sorting protein [Gemmatimonadota bacterium]
MRFRARLPPGGRASLLLFGPLVLAVGGPVSAQTDPRALAIIDEVDRLWRGESSQARVSMAIETENWSRTLELDSWSLGTEYSLIRVLSPAREAGTATLKVDDEVWNYLPRVDRTIKVPPSMMVGSWMGSHFTNDDLVRESRLIEDYDIIISFEGVREGGAGDGQDVWEFTMTPKPEAPVIWGKIVQEVRKADRMPTWARYYDEDGELVRQMSFSGYREMGGRLVPRTMTVEPSDSDERTVVTYHELTFDLGLSQDFFSLRNLRARN